MAVRPNTGPVPLGYRQEGGCGEYCQPPALTRMPRQARDNLRCCLTLPRPLASLLSTPAAASRATRLSSACHTGSRWRMSGGHVISLPCHILVLVSPSSLRAYMDSAPNKLALFLLHLCFSWSAPGPSLYHMLVLQRSSNQPTSTIASCTPPRARALSLTFSLRLSLCVSVSVVSASVYLGILG